MSVEQKIAEEWKHFWTGPECLNSKSLQNAALSGNLDGYPHLRCIFWRIFLGIISTDTENWLLEVEKERVMYSQLRAKYLASADQTSHADDFHPLAATEKSEAEQVDNDLKKLIMQDVERTFPDFNFFRQPLVQESMCDALFIYCKLNPDVSYRQGMHEILAPILFILKSSYFRKESSKSSSEVVLPKELQQDLFNVDFMEHDAFGMFNRIMLNLKPLFAHGDNSCKESPNYNHTSLFDEPFKASGSSKFQQETPILRRCVMIQYQMLKIIDLELCEHLKSLEIEPQLYGMYGNYRWNLISSRWLRLLFGREFSFDQVFKLWDIIFSFMDHDFSILDWVSVAFLIIYKPCLMSDDYSTVLHTLMKYPCEKDPVEVGKLARQLYHKYNLVISKDLSPVTLTKTPISPSRIARKSSGQIFPGWVKSIKKNLVEPIIFGANSPQNELSTSETEMNLRIVELLQGQIRDLEEVRAMSDEAMKLFQNYRTSSSEEEERRMEFLLKAINVSLINTISSLSTFDQTRSSTIANPSKPPSQTDLTYTQMTLPESSSKPISINDLMKEVESMEIETSKQQAEKYTRKMKLFESSNESIQRAKSERKKKLGDLLK